MIKFPTFRRKLMNWKTSDLKVVRSLAEFQELPVGSVLHLLDNFQMDGVSIGPRPGNPIVNANKYKLYIIGYDGHISGGVYSRDNIGIRPGVRLNMDLIAVASGSGTRNDPFILRYTGEIPTATPEPDPEATTAPGQDAEPDPTPEPELIPAPEPKPDDSDEIEDPDDEDEDFDEPEDSDEFEDPDDEDEDFDEPEDPEDPDEPEEQPAGEGETPEHSADAEAGEPEQTVSRENTALVSFLGD